MLTSALIVNKTIWPWNRTDIWYIRENVLFATTQPLDTHHSNNRNQHTQIPCTAGGLGKKKEMIS